MALTEFQLACDGAEFIRTLSTCQYVNLSTCQLINLSTCQPVNKGWCITSLSTYTVRPPSVRHIRLSQHYEGRHPHVSATDAYISKGVLAAKFSVSVPFVQPPQRKRQILPRYSLFQLLHHPRNPRSYPSHNQKLPSEYEIWGGFLTTLG